MPETATEQKPMIAARETGKIWYNLLSNGIFFHTGFLPTGTINIYLSKFAFNIWYLDYGL